MLRTSVVICAHTLERWDILSRAVSSVNAQHPAADEVIVVIDNNPEMLARARAELPAMVLENRYGAGASGARNTGVEASGSAVIVFLDDDAVPEPGWLAALVEPLEDPRHLGSGGRTVPDWVGGAPTWLPEEFFWVIGCDWPGIATPEGRMRNPIAVNMAIHREDYLAVEGMGHVLTRMGSGTAVSGTAEETELSLRLNALHPERHFVQAPTAVVHHQVPASRATWAYFSARCRTEGVAKAKLSRAVGPATSLSTETAYVRAILPAAVLANLRAALAGDRSGLARAGTIVAGLAITAMSYLGERARGARGARRR